MIINTPQSLDDLHVLGASSDIGDHQADIFDIEALKPARDHVFFMEDDFYHKLPDKKQEVPEDKVKEIVLDQADTTFDNKLLNTKEFIPDQKQKMVLVSDNRRPIYGVLSEPLRGDM